jgi:penicillin amidase
MEGLRSPAQNLTVADRGGHIAIRSTGAVPVRNGDRLLDGSTSEHDWTQWIGITPSAIDPVQGFAASANQQPVDPRTFAGYMGNEWPTPWRAMRINELLRAHPQATAEDMRRFQTDPRSARADAFAPLFLDAAARDTADTLLTRAARLLAEWDRAYTLDNERAALFEEAMRLLTQRTWDELATHDSAGRPTAILIATPAEGVLLALANDSTSVWWDHRDTPEQDDRDMVLRHALRTALERLEADRGTAGEGRWRWALIRHANIWHPLRVPALSALSIPVQGGSGTLNPSSGTGVHGASWRLVVELAPELRAWGIYPGGQSANPVSPRYRDRIDAWSRGTLDSLRIPRRPPDLAGRHRSGTLVLVPGTH